MDSSVLMVSRAASICRPITSRAASPASRCRWTAVPGRRARPSIGHPGSAWRRRSVPSDRDCRAAEVSSLPGPERADVHRDQFVDRPRPGRRDPVAGRRRRSRPWSPNRRPRTRSSGPPIDRIDDARRPTAAVCSRAGHRRPRSARPSPASWARDSWSVSRRDRRPRDRGWPRLPWPTGTDRGRSCPEPTNADAAWSTMAAARLSCVAVHGQCGSCHAPIPLPVVRSRPRASLPPDRPAAHAVCPRMWTKFGHVDKRRAPVEAISRRGCAAIGRDRAGHHEEMTSTPSWHVAGPTARDESRRLDHGGARRRGPGRASPGCRDPPPPGRTELVLGGGVNVRCRARTAGRTPAWYVHGLGGSSTDWTRLAAALAPRATGYSLDLPGSGRSDPPPAGRYSPAVDARIVASTIEQRDRRTGPPGRQFLRRCGRHPGGGRVAAPGAHADRARAGRSRPAADVAIGVPTRGSGLLLLPGTAGLAYQRLGSIPPMARARGMGELCFGRPEVVTDRDYALAAREHAWRANLPWAHEATIGTLRGLMNWHLRRGRRSFAAAAGTGSGAHPGGLGHPGPAGGRAPVPAGRGGLSRVAPAGDGRLRPRTADGGTRSRPHGRCSRCGGTRSPRTGARDRLDDAGSGRARRHGRSRPLWQPRSVTWESGGPRRPDAGDGHGPRTPLATTGRVDPAIPASGCRAVAAGRGAGCRAPTGSRSSAGRSPGRTIRVVTVRVVTVGGPVPSPPGQRSSSPSSSS